MSGRKWFEARGQSLKARGYDWSQAKTAIRFYTLPEWAQSAFARGHMIATRGAA